MHGLIFVTWEKYLAERFGGSLLEDYRRAIGEGIGETPLVSRVYDDEQLLAGIAAASRLTRAPVDTLLYEYGHYFILNGLTSRLCTYLLNQVHSGRDLLLMMSRAHEQMSQTGGGITPPLFGYQPMPGDPAGLVLSYDSPRQLCTLLRGSIEGAAIRYGERAQVSEDTCMKHGAPACTFTIRFMRPSTPSLAQRSGTSATPLPATTSGASSTPGASVTSVPPYPAHEDQQRWEAQQRLADQVYAVLPDADGMTLAEVRERLHARFPRLAEAGRPFVVLEALNHLHHAGWIATSANEPGDVLGSRRHWRAPRVAG
ncbi:MAG TPA: heme NO-binding domain-containing protein [Ktedonobacterales bacterium]